jgi:hypothetical protein
MYSLGEKGMFLTSYESSISTLDLKFEMIVSVLCNFQSIQQPKLAMTTIGSNTLFQYYLTCPRRSLGAFFEWHAHNIGRIKFIWHKIYKRLLHNLGTIKMYNLITSSKWIDADCIISFEPMSGNSTHVVHLR